MTLILRDKARQPSVTDLLRLGVQQFVLDVCYNDSVELRAIVESAADVDDVYHQLGKYGRKVVSVDVLHLVPRVGHIGRYCFRSDNRFHATDSEISYASCAEWAERQNLVFTAEPYEITATMKVGDTKFDMKPQGIKDTLKEWLHSLKRAVAAEWAKGWRAKLGKKERNPLEGIGTFWDDAPANWQELRFRDILRTCHHGGWCVECEEADAYHNVRLYYATLRRMGIPVPNDQRARDFRNELGLEHPDEPPKGAA